MSRQRLATSEGVTHQVGIAGVAVAPKVIAAPPDLARALKGNQAAQAIWGKLSYSHRKEYVQEIMGAKKPETRARRIKKTLEALKAVQSQTL